MKRKTKIGAGVLCSLLLLGSAASLAGCSAKETDGKNPTVTEAPSQGQEEPTKAPTTEPTKAPTPEPTKTPTPEPTKAPTPEPTKAPTESGEEAKGDSEMYRFGFGEESAPVEVNIEIQCPTEYLVNSVKVNYGKIVKTSYYSTTCEKDRNVIVLLPDGYTEEKEYPVLYVLHGIFGDETSMIGDGNSGIRITVGNMIAKGAAEEMIVVFPYMYASKTQDVCTAIDLANTAAYDNFVNDLADDLMPFLKENYSVASGRENTAIIGFSMGGRESLAIGFMRPDLFGYVGAIAPAPGLTPGRDWAMAHPGQFEEEELVFAEDEEPPYVLMVCSGDADSVVGSFPKSYHNILLRNQVSHYWWEIPGSDHGDPAITSGIYNFCKVIFKAE